MSSGAKQLVQIAKETVIGTVPSPFARQTLAFTDISLNQSVEKTESASITDSRLQQSSMVTSAEYSGELSAEAQYGAYDDLMAAAAFNAWATNVLTFGGTTRQTFSVLLGYTDIANYHTFSGLHVNTFGIDIPESGLIGLTFGFMGTKRTPAAVAPAGTITPASSNPRMSNISVGDLLVDGTSVKGTACITALLHSHLIGITQCKCKNAWVLDLRLVQFLKCQPKVQVALLWLGLRKPLSFMKSNLLMGISHSLFQLRILLGINTF